MTLGATVRRVALGVVHRDLALAAMGIPIGLRGGVAGFEARGRLPVTDVHSPALDQPN